MKWFKHDTDANLDAKLQNVLLDYGLEGYGLYWYCIELIASKIDQDNLTFELEHDARIIARNTGSTVQKVEEMMRYFVKQNLFEDQNGMVTCMRLLKRIDKSMTGKTEMRDAIDALKQSQSHDDIMTTSCSGHDSVMIKNRLEKTRLDETRLDETRIEKEPKAKASRFVPPTHTEVQEYCNQRANQVDSERFVDFYEAKGWMVGKNKMKDWKAALRTWEKNNNTVKTTGVQVSKTEFF